MKSTHKPSQTVYEIKVQGELDQSWETFFKGLAVRPGHPEGQAAPTTILVGPMTDQSALRGLLCKLWDLNLTLISVRRLEEDLELGEKK
ncbi:MAG: hypothetical protein JXB15_17085 [Anaerolineales bacterium]|nr:hypothetical protein [Anaerolineales bacterium]